MSKQSDRVADLLDRHRQRLLACIVRRITPALAARLSPDDILQDAYCETRREYDRSGQLPDADQEFACLYRTARDCLATAWRSATAQKRDFRQDEAIIDLSSCGFAPIDTATGPGTAAGRADLNRCVHEVLDSLKPEYREILMMHGLDQLSLSEVGDVLGISENNAGVRYWRATKAFRDAWRERFPEEARP